MGEREAVGHERSSEMQDHLLGHHWLLELHAHTGKSCGTEDGGNGCGRGKPSLTGYLNENGGGAILHHSQGLEQLQGMEEDWEGEGDGHP